MRRPFARAGRSFALVAWAAGIAVLLALGIAAPAALAADRAAGGSRPPGGNFADPVVRAVDIAQPAVVRIGTEELATLSLQLCTRTVTLPLDGTPYQLGLLGSGAFISSHGDILTADHVVDVPDVEVALFAAQDIANVLNNQTSFDPGCPGNLRVTANDIASGAVNFNFTAHVSDVRTLVWMSTGYSGPLAITAIRDVPRQDATKTVSSSYNDDDLAIIHVNLDDTPSVRLDDSATVAVEDQLTVIGFPGNGDLNNDATNFLTPSVNQVMVNAIKTADNGSALIQVGGNVEHGDSGGPVLDSAGHIVGVVSFGGIADPLGDTTFLRTSDSALALIRGQGIDLTPGAFEQLWTRAFTDYASSYTGHWTVAAREMTQLATGYPRFLALTPYLTFAHSAAASEARAAHTTITHTPSLTVLLAVLGVMVVLAAALGVGVWLLVRSTRRPAPVAGFVPPGMSPMPYPNTGVAYPPPPWMAYPVGQGYGTPSPPADPHMQIPTLNPGVVPGNDFGQAVGGTGGYTPPLLSTAPAAYQSGAHPAFCANGHAVNPADAFCSHCGARVSRVLTARPGVPSATSAMSAPAESPADQ